MRGKIKIADRKVRIFDMKNKKRALRAITCIGVGVVMLTVAVFANYDNANGYDTIKTALKNMLMNERNYTENTSVEFKVNDQILGAFNINSKVDKDGEAQYQTVETSSSSNGVEYERSTTIQDGWMFEKSVYPNAIGQSPNAYKSKLNGDDVYAQIINGGDLMNKTVNVVESLADLFVGDMKNNIILVGTEDGNRTYSISMTGEQLPQYITSVFSLVSASIKASYENIDPSAATSEIESADEIFRSDVEPVISAVNGLITIDEHDRITSSSGDIVITGYNLSGQKIDISLSMSGGAGDFGTTVIDKVNPDEYQEDPYSSSSVVYYENTNGEVLTFDSEEALTEYLNNEENAA